jgi:hypothetical protein
MVIVGLLLELAIYGWLLAYQPRWLTLLLALLEFFLLKWIVEWPYPFELRLHTRQALEFYIPAWLLGWFITLVIVPVLWPRWAEDGGEFRRVAHRNTAQRAHTQGGVARRRMAYVLAWLGMVWVLLPWFVAALAVPAGYHFTGLLLMEHGHLHALAQATAVIHGADAHSFAGMLGTLAQWGRWPVLPIYFIAWVVAGMAWLLGIQMYAWNGPASSIHLVTIGCLPLLLFPVPWLLVAALLVWSLVMLQQRVRAPQYIVRWVQRGQVALRHPTRFVYLITLIGTIGTLIVWVSVWIRAPIAPLAYVDEGTWQALVWLSEEQDTIPRRIAAPLPAADLVRALTDYTIVGEHQSAPLRLTSGHACTVAEPVFRHGTRCIVAVPYPLAE